MLDNFSWISFAIGVVFAMFVLPFVQSKVFAPKTAPTASRTA